MVSKVAVVHDEVIARADDRMDANLIRLAANTTVGYCPALTTQAQALCRHDGQFLRLIQPQQHQHKHRHFRKITHPTPHIIKSYHHHLICPLILHGCILWHLCLKCASDIICLALIPQCVALHAVLLGHHITRKLAMVRPHG